MSVSVCRNFLTSWLTGSQAYRGNVDTWLPRKGLDVVLALGGNGRLATTVPGPSAQPGDQRYIFAGKFSLDGSFGFHWCSVHWILWWGKKIIYSKIPVFSYSHPHLSLRIMSQVFLLTNCSCSFRLGWKLEQLKVGRVFPQFCRWKTLIPCVLIGIVQYRESQTEIQI